MVNNFNQEETTNSLSSQDIANKTIDYINANMLEGQTTAVLNTVEESGDLYLLK